MLATLPPFVEVTLAFADGSAHVTPMCRTCALALPAESPDALEDLYCADLAEMEAAERQGGGPAPWTVLEREAPTVARITASDGRVLFPQGV